MTPRQQAQIVFFAKRAMTYYPAPLLLHWFFEGQHDISLESALEAHQTFVLKRQMLPALNQRWDVIRPFVARTVDGDTLTIYDGAELRIVSMTPKIEAVVEGASIYAALVKGTHVWSELQHFNNVLISDTTPPGMRAMSYGLNALAGASPVIAAIPQMTRCLALEQFCRFVGRPARRDDSANVERYMKGVEAEMIAAI